MDASGCAIKLAFLDASRTDPFQEFGIPTQTPLWQPTSGTFVGYATAPGSNADDGQGDHSPFAIALSEGIVAPSTSIADMFQQLRGKVLALTGENQTVWDHSWGMPAFSFTSPQ